VTSRKLRQEFSDYLSSFYCKDVFWNGSYFVASCGGITISTLRRYIKNQNQPDCSDNPWPQFIPRPHRVSRGARVRKMLN